MIPTDGAAASEERLFDSESPRGPVPRLCFREDFYPLGFPLRLISNSHAILEAAEQSWGCFRPMFAQPPLELLLGVKEDRVSGPLPPAPGFSLRGDLMMNTADQDNFVVANLSTGRAAGWVSETTAASTRYLRYHFLEAAVLTMIAALRTVAIHAACIVTRGRGVLICGESGAGKSSLAYAGARAGWTYVSDDATYLVLGREDRLVVGNSHSIRFRPSAAQLFPAIERHPVTPRAVGKPSIEIPTAEWPEMATQCTATIDHIVFLNRGGTEPGLSPLEPSTMLPRFDDPITTRRLQEVALAELLAIGGFELRYCDLPWAIDRINRLAEEGR